MSVKAFSDDRIMHLENDIEKIQVKPYMYIGGGGPRGTFQLFKEGFNNMLDECVNRNSPGNEIDIYLDEVENSTSISDNGRGIPFDDMEVACTKLQAGSKFYREHGGGSAGENGVGMTAQNALSEFFEIVSRRNGEKAHIRFEGGYLKEPLKVKKDRAEAHGTTVKFKPNPYFLGEDCQFPKDEIMDWLDIIVAAVPHNIKTTLTINRKGKESTINKKYQNKEGMLTLCKRAAKKQALEPIHFLKSKKLPEIVTVRKEGSTNPTDLEQKELLRFIGLEVAFTYDATRGADIHCDSICNYVVTYEHGIHVDAVRTGIIHYLGRQTRDALSEKEAKTIEITSADITNGLVMSVYLNSELNPQFGGQTKEKVTNSILFKPLRDMTYSALDEHFKKNPKELKRATDYIKTVAKARIEANKARNSVMKKSANIFDLHSIDKFFPANNKGKNDYRELFIIEGDSAAGSANRGRFRDFQALFAMRGVPLNTFGLKLDKAMANKEFFNLVRALRCMIGEKFDITLCDYDKIIIMTDSDVDGFRIFSLLCVFFAVHLPGLVEAGRIYKAVAPLYKIKDKKDSQYILNRQGFIKKFEERIGDSIRLVSNDTQTIMSKDRFREFLMNNRQYLEEVQRVAGYYAIQWELLEQIAIFYSLNGDVTSKENRNSFVKTIRKQFPELNLDDDNVLSGIIDNRYQIITVDQLLYKRLKTLHNLISEVNNNEYEFKVLEKLKGEYEDKGIMTIGKLMSMCQKFQPIIQERYKGLGELNPTELRDTTLDPNNRILIQLTMEDINVELEKLRVLHGDSIEERKNLMNHYQIAREDLDN